jgi:formylglycine-generating enzyme required for sulfatase activity
MGSTHVYPKEGPLREVEVNGFAIQLGPVTVPKFARFIDATRT